MAIRTIDDWKGQPFLATRFFAPLVRSSTLAVAATQEETHAFPIAARVVSARNAGETAYLFDEAAVALLYNNQTNTTHDSFRDHEFYARKFVLSVWCQGDQRLPNTRFGSVTMADKDEGAAMIGYDSDRCEQAKCAGYMVLEVQASRVVNIKDPAVLAKRALHSSHNDQELRRSRW
jgi:hypothetical protein